MYLKRTLCLVAGATTALAVTACQPQVGTDKAAAEFPRKAVHVVVPYAPGGPSDLAARAVGACLEKQLDETVVVENKPGGGGAIGIKSVTSSKADGHTLGLISPSTAVVAPLISDDVGYTYQDLAPIGEIYAMPSVLLVRGDAPYRSAEELLAAAKAKPGSIKVGTPGASTLYHIELGRLAKAHGITLSGVPFQGGAPVVAALLGGNVDAIFLEASENVLTHVESGKFRALATGSPDPVPYLQKVPTLASLGYADLTMTRTFFALAAPAKTPDAAVDTLGEAMRTCTADAEVRKRLGERYVPKEFVDGQQVARHLAEANDTYSPILAKKG